MTSSQCSKHKQIQNTLDERIKRVDEARWLSSRYAAPIERDTLIALYAFYYELARVRLAVSDTTLGQIRYEWWRETLTLIEAGTPRDHDLSLCLDHYVRSERLQISSLSELINASETAFIAADRGAEPEARLAQIAAGIVAPGISWQPAWGEVATVWSALRRGDEVSAHCPLIQVPGPIRPALAHFRLRRAWQNGVDRNAAQPLRQRLTILWAMMSGYC